MKKRILSIILAIAMIACMIPLGTMTAFAETSVSDDILSMIDLKGVEVTNAEQQINKNPWGCGYDGCGHNSISSPTYYLYDKDQVASIQFTFSSEYDFNLKFSYRALAQAFDNTNCYFEVIVDNVSVFKDAGAKTGTYQNTLAAGTHTVKFANIYNLYQMYSCQSYIYGFSAIADLPNTESSFAGKGEKAEPFCINSLADMETLANIVNTGRDDFTGTYFKLTADIGSKNGEDNYTGLTNAIGTEEHPFNGYFNGDGHTVFSTVQTSEYSGVFGVTGEKATVCNLNVGGNMSATEAVGGIVGYNKGTVLNCTNKATVASNSICGGIAGKNEGAVYNCVNAGICVTTAGKIGGVCGENIGGMIVNCINTGVIKANNTYGGVCAFDNDGTIFNCYYDSTQYSAATDSGIFGITGLAGTEMKAESGEAGALIDRLNGYTERGKYPSGWLKWTKAEGKYPQLPYHVGCVDANGGKITVINTEPLKYNLANYFGAGETVSLTVTPDEHYEIASVMYNGSPATKADDGTYYFTMPASSVTVTAEFSELPHTHTDASGNVITFQPWTDSTSLPTSGNWYLTADVQLPGEGWNISNNVNLCLNGHIIALFRCQKTITITNGATFSLYDCGTTEHKFYEVTGSEPHWEIDLDGRFGTKTVTGGVITGVYLHDRSVLMDNKAITIENGTFNMYGGNICGNYSAQNRNGLTVQFGDGGLFGGSSQTFNMYGGAFCGNYGYYGCVQTPMIRDFGHGMPHPGQEEEEPQPDSFNMYGGKFYENSGWEASAINARGPVSILGGEICNNLGPVAVLALFDETGTVTIGGSAVISDNEGGNLKATRWQQAGSVTFAEGEYAPQKGMHIGLSYADERNLTQIRTDYPFYMSYLYSDDSSMCIKYNSENEWLELAPIEDGEHKISIEPTENGNALYDHQYAKQDERVQIHAIPDSEDYIVKSVKFNGQDATEKGNDIYYFSMPDEEVTVSVEFAPAKIYVNVPTAASGLVYNGEEQTGVAQGEGYTLTDSVKTDAGNYTAVATLEEGYCWSDGSSEPAEINWSIAKIKVDVPTLAKDIYLFSGSEITAVADGDYYTVEGGSATAPGKYTATVTLDDTTNYEWKTAFDGKYVWYIVNTEYYLTLAPTITEDGTYNQRAFYMDGDSKVIVKERMFYNDLTVDFAGWYLRTFVQCKPGEVEGSTDVRFISMLNGGSFDGTNLTDYEYAGFTVEIDGEKFDVVTNVASTSFLANGKEIKISDYSNEDDYFFLKNFVFGSEVPDDMPIKVTPFVKLMDSETVISGKTVSFTIGILK